MRSCSLLYLVADTVFCGFTDTSPPNVVDYLLFDLDLLLQFLNIVLDVLLILLYLNRKESVEHLLKLFDLVSGLFLVKFNMIEFLDIYIEDLLVYVFMLYVLDIILIDFLINHYFHNLNQILSDVINHILC